METPPCRGLVWLALRRDRDHVLREGNPANCADLAPLSPHTYLNDDRASAGPHSLHPRTLLSSSLPPSSPPPLISSRSSSVLCLYSSPQTTNPCHSSNLSSTSKTKSPPLPSSHPPVYRLFLTMLTTQSPTVPPRIHSLYSELPPNSRRAANLPFFAPRPLATSTPSCAPNLGSASGAPPFIPRRNSMSRRNAISYHPSQPASETPFSRAQSVCASASASAYVVTQPASPRPRAALLVTSGYTSEPKPMTTVASSPPLVISLAPARVPRSQREYQAKMVANLLLNRASRARPMRCARRGSALRTAGYQPSRLCESILPGDVDKEEVNFEEELARA